MKSAERHQLKQNEFAETTMRVTAYLTANRTRVLAVVAALAVLVAAVAGVLAYRKRQTDQAGALLGAAMSIAQSPIAPAPSLPGASQQPGTFPTEEARTEATLKALAEVVDQYPNTDSATVAAYQMGVTLLNAGRLDEAEQQFAKVVDEHQDDFYTVLSSLGRAEVAMAKNDFDRAALVYSEVANKVEALPADGVLMKLAQAYAKAGKPQEARATYQRVVDEFPESPYVDAARQQISTMN